MELSIIASRINALHMANYTPGLIPSKQADKLVPLPPFTGLGNIEHMRAGEKSWGIFTLNFHFLP